MTKESAYCMKCKEKREFEASYKEYQTKRGVKGYLSGSCPVCNTKMGKFVKPRNEEMEE